MPPPARKPSLADFMILIAATAAGLSSSKGAVPEILHILPTSPSVSFLIPRRLLEPSLLALAAWPLPAMWTLALLLIRLRSPRPPWRRLIRQPGVMACCAVAVACLLNATALAALALRGGHTTNFLPVAAVPVGFAVTVAWAALVLAGRWRPVSSPLDRIGRALGFYWVAMVPLGCLVFITLLR